LSDLRLGVIGLGCRSTLADLAHQPGAGSAVVAVCDTDPDALEQAPKRFGVDVRATTSLDDLLDEGVDAVFVLTPDDTHEPIAVRTLEAGVHTFLEKPMAITTEGCDRLLRTARRTGARLYVGHNMRHMPVVRAMRDLILDGAIGAVKAVWCRHFVGNGGDYYFKDWHADRRRVNSLLLQKAAHDLDVIHWLAGGASRLVNALGGLVVYGEITDRRDRTGERMIDWLSHDNWPPLSHTGLNPVVDVEDISQLNARLDNGVFAAYQQCHFTPDYWRNYTVIGTEGRLENFGDGLGAEVKVWQRRSEYRSDADMIVGVGGSDDNHGGADPLLVAEFLEFVRHGGPTLTSPVAAREAVAAGCAATESLRGGGVPVQIPPLPENLVQYFAEGQASPA